MRQLGLSAVLIIMVAVLNDCRGYGPPPRMKATTLALGHPVGGALQGLLSPSADERRWSIIILSRSGDPDMVEPLTAMLNPRTEPIPLVRATAAEGLRVLGDARALPKLLGASLDLEAVVRAEVARSLGALGAEDEVPTLARMLRADSDDTVRLEAAYALREIGGMKALSALTDVLDDANESIVFAAHDSLVALTGKELPPSRKAWRDVLSQPAGK